MTHAESVHRTIHHSPFSTQHSAFSIPCSVCRCQQHRVQEEQLGCLGKRSVIRILGEGDDVAAAHGLVHEVRALGEQRLGKVTMLR